MLGQLTEADEEQVELRLLTDASYSEEMDITVNELIDEYVREELSAEERKQMEQHFFNSSTRRDKLRFALALKKRKSEVIRHKNRGGSFFRFYLPIAASVLLLLGISAGLWWAFFHQSDLNKGMVAFQTAYREQRPVEARISGLTYAPALEQRGGTEKIDYLQRDRATMLLLNAVSENPGAETHHALGMSYLAARQFDRALEQFEAALKFDSQQAQVHSDLGAALLEKAKSHASESERGKVIEEFARSLEHLNKALELDSSQLEALFNRALLYQHMRLPRQAEEDWRKYLEKDQNSKWADEARQRLRTLEEQQNKTSRNKEQAVQDFFFAYERGDHEKAWEVISQNYTSAGNTITNLLLDSYLDQQLKGDARTANSKLEALAYVGELEFRKAGDSYTTGLSRFYSLSSPRQRLALAGAREQMKKGHELFIHSNIKNALSHYEQAKQTFSENGDDYEATFAEYRIGHSYWLKPNLKRSDEIFERLLSTCELKNFRWLLSQSLYRMASIRLTFNEYSESIDYARRALKQSEQIHDAVGVLRLLIILGDQYRSLNNERQALNFFQRALTLTSEEFAETPEIWGTLTGIALTLNSLGLHGAALEYQKEALRLALEMKRPLQLSRSYDYLGLTYGSLKIYDAALSNIDLAFEAGRKLSDESAQLELTANSSLHAGDIYLKIGDYDKAVESYELSIKMYKELEYPYFVYPAHKGKLLSFIAKGNDSATEEELQTVLKLSEEYRSKLTNEQQRNTFFDVEQSIYDLAIAFVQFKKGDTRKAFEYSELSRARSLRDAMQQNLQVSEWEQTPELRLPNTFTPLALSDIQQQMPRQVQIIQYAVLDNKLLIWVVDPFSITHKEVPVDAKTLGEKVGEYLRAIDRPDAGAEAETEKKAKELYDLLVKPVESLLGKTKSLCIVPDKVLHYVPFGAFISGVTGRYLVQDFRLTISPSSTVFVDCSGRAAQHTRATEERLLSVGDPSFDGEAFPLLRPLASAGREAEAVAALYTSPLLLLRDDAREKVVKSEIRRSDVAHFALHHVVDDRSDLLSKMVLAAERDRNARDKEDDGVLQSREIYKIKLPQTRLVILSACQTGIEQQYRGEGAVSIARPFIVAGVPLVVASLWPVDSESTKQLMISFHRHRTRDHLPTAEALRLAQLELLGGDDTRYRHPYYWAAFTAIGGDTEY